VKSTIATVKTAKDQYSSKEEPDIVAPAELDTDNEAEIERSKQLENLKKRRTTGRQSTILTSRSDSNTKSSILDAK
jgi:hypothetical protein